MLTLFLLISVSNRSSGPSNWSSLYVNCCIIKNTSDVLVGVGAGVYDLILQERNQLPKIEDATRHKGEEISEYIGQREDAGNKG